MAQQPPKEPMPDEERLEEEEEPQEYVSATLLGGLYQAAQGLGRLSSVLFGGGLLAVALGGIVYLLIEDLRPYGAILLGAGAVLLLAAMAASWSAVRSTLVARRGRYGINTVVMVASFVGIAAIGNFLAFEYTTRLDVTATNQFSLAARTKTLLKGLDEPVKARAFFVEEDPAQALRFESVENMLREFKARSGRFART